MNNDTDHINFEIEKFSLDSSVVIAFFNSNLEHILRVVFKNKIYFSSEIFKEIKRYDLDSFNCHIVNTKTVEESEYFYQLSGEHISLSVADAQLITICKFNNIVCVSFEKKMRKVCNEENIKNIIVKDGCKEIIEPKALNSFINTLPDDIVIPVTKSLSIKKAPIKRITPVLNTNPLEPRAILLAIYEFLYLCCFGEQILDNRFDFIRNSILSGEIDSRIEINSFYTRREYLPYHILICNKDEVLKLKFIIFNAIYNTVNIENIKLVDNNGYIFIDHLLKKKFYYNNNLEEAKKNNYYIF